MNDGKAVHWEGVVYAPIFTLGEASRHACAYIRIYDLSRIDKSADSYRLESSGRAICPPPGTSLRITAHQICAYWRHQASSATYCWHLVARTQTRGKQRVSLPGTTFVLHRPALGSGP